MTPLDQRKSALLARLAELDARLHRIEDALDEPVEKDWEDAAVEREEDEVLQNIGASGLQEVEMIRAALARIEAGEYGFCVRCGAEIGEERLNVLPATPFCRNCAT